MKTYARIICDDTRFSRMLELELRGIGIESVVDFTYLDESDKLYVVADLDSVEIEVLRELSYLATIIGFGTSYRMIHDEIESICSAVLRRPFLVSEFLSLFKSSGISTEEKIGRASRGKRYQYLTADPITRSAVWGNMKIPLSDNEFKILSVLCENRGELVDREHIHSLIGASDGNIGDVYICHLRRKIDNKLGLKLIYTIRGKGYMLKN